MHRRSLLAGGPALLVGGPALLVDGPSAAAGATVRVALRTEAGPIEIELFTARAPRSAGAFLAVVDRGGYDGGAFTRVVRPENDHGRPPISVVQAAARVEAPLVPHESTALTGLRHGDGTVSLPRDRPGTATGGGFFVCIGDQPALDHGGSRNPDGQGFAAFGRVVAGMGAVRQVWSRAATGAGAHGYTAGQMLDPPVRILGAQRIG